MKINVSERNLSFWDLAKFIRDSRLNDNTKVVYESENGTHNLTYCQHGDLVTFIPDYDESVEPLTIGSLKTIIEHSDSEGYIAINFAERSEIHGINDIARNEATWDLMFII